MIKKKHVLLDLYLMANGDMEAEFKETFYQLPQQYRAQALELLAEAIVKETHQFELEFSETETMQ